jgi:hypothetical protein
MKDYSEEIGILDVEPYELVLDTTKERLKVELNANG